MRPSRFLAIPAILLALAISSPAQTVTTLFSFTSQTGNIPSLVIPAQGRDGTLYGTTSDGGTYRFGTLYRQRTGGDNATLYNFSDGADGGVPIGGVILGGDGNLYGTTQHGGTYSFGVLYKMSRSGVLAALYSFANGPDGAYPAAPPIEGFDGNFYGTTQGLTTSTVYKYVPSSATLSTIYTADDINGNQFQSFPLQTTDGSLYIVANSGGASGCGSILKLSVIGTLLATSSFPCGTGGLSPNGPIIQASDDDIYGTTSSGGTFNHGTIFELTSTGGITTLYSFGASGETAENILAGLKQGSDGNFYGTASAGGTFDGGLLFEFTLSGVYSTLYNFPQESSGVPYPFTPMQHSNGLFYGTTSFGGINELGSIYQLFQGARPFVEFVRSRGHVGARAQILGQGLTGTTRVTFNGIAATSFTVVNDTYMAALVPSGATTGKVVVTTPGGTLTSNVNFRIVQ